MPTPSPITIPPLLAAMFVELLFFPLIYAAFSGSDNALHFFDSLHWWEQIIVVTPYFVAKSRAIWKIWKKEPNYDYNQVLVTEVLSTCGLFFLAVIISLILLQFIELPDIIGTLVIIPLLTTLMLQGLGVLPLALVQDFLDRRRKRKRN